MNNKMREIMETSWSDWHGSTIDDFPNVNISYEKGFDAACDKLIPLLEQASHHVYGSAGAEHLLDGFHPRRRQIDDLVDSIKEVID